MRNLKSPFFAIILLFAMLLLIGVPLLSRGSLIPQTDTDDGNPIEWRSEKLGFRTTYPSKWQALEDPRELIGANPTSLHAVAFVPNPDSKSLVVVYVQTLTETQTLDQFVSRQMEPLLANEVRAEFTPPASAQLGGQEARATTALVTTENPPRQQQVIMTIKGSKAYAVYYSGQPEGRYAAVFQAIVESFVFLP